MDAPQSLDILLLLKLASRGGGDAPLRRLEAELGVPRSTLALSVRRLRALGLVKPDGDGNRIDRLATRHLLEHGLRWIAPASVGDWELGLPTAHSAPPLSERLRGDEDTLVMPLPHGPVRGRAVPPVHPCAPKAAEQDPKLRRLLALADALRVGRARDRQLASEELRACL